MLAPLLLALATPAPAAEVVVFGDSWAAGAGEHLQGVLRDRGHTGLTVDNQGVPGSTAEQWATEDTAALSEAVAANPDARWVWLSIGGNDLFWHHAHDQADQTAAANDAHIRAMLDDLFATHPDVKVVTFGYDFVNFEQSTDCWVQAYQIFGVVTTPEVNGYFLDQVGAVQQAIAEDDDRVTYVPTVWGTLQDAGGVPDAPNVDRPSPSQYFVDCIHPTGEGYRLILGELVDQWWGKEPPEASFTVEPAEPAPGDPVTLTSTATDAEWLAWTVDGQPAGSSPILELTPTGPVEVALHAHAGPWEDRSARTLAVATDTGEGADGDTGVVDTGGPTDLEETVDATPAGCGCASAPAASGWLFLVLGPLVLRRRARG